MQRVFIGALCRQMSSCNQSERDAIFGRDSYERKLSNHHDQGRRQGTTAIIEFFSVTHTSKNFEGARGRLCSSKGASVPWHNGTMASPSLIGRLLFNRSIFFKDCSRLGRVRYSKKNFWSGLLVHDLYRPNSVLVTQSKVSSH